MENVESLIGQAAAKIANNINANCIVSFEKDDKAQFIENNEIGIKANFFIRLKKGVYKKSEFRKKVKRFDQGSITQIKEFLMEGINKNYIKKGDKVVCVQNESLGVGLKGALLILDIDKLLFDIGIHKLSKYTSTDVLESTLNIAKEIAIEGREGRKVGTAFIIGKREEILKYVKQLIINPFEGHSEEHRKITDPNIKETIKEFSQIDGVFILDNQGTIITSGAYLTINTEDINLPPGFGTRHRSCAAITKESDSIAIVISESGGQVRVFKRGNIVLKL